MATAALRRRYANAHAQMRHILALFLDCSPGAIRYTRGPQGKPALEQEGLLRFNLSHSEGIGLLAVCLGQETGVDVEFPRENIDLTAIARRFFAPIEAETIIALPPADRQRAFLACWTRKEAYIKLLGGGLSIPLDGFAVSVHPGKPVSIHDTASDSPITSCSLYEIDPGSGCAAALAVSGRLSAIDCWDWSLPN